MSRGNSINGASSPEVLMRKAGLFSTKFFSIRAQLVNEDSVSTSFYIIVFFKGQKYNVLKLLTIKVCQLADLNMLDIYDVLKGTVDPKIKKKNPSYL